MAVKISKVKAQLIADKWEYDIVSEAICLARENGCDSVTLAPLLKLSEERGYAYRDGCSKLLSLMTPAKNTIKLKSNWYAVRYVDNLNEQKLSLAIISESHLRSLTRDCRNEPELTVDEIDTLMDFCMDEFLTARYVRGMKADAEELVSKTIGVEWAERRMVEPKVEFNPGVTTILNGKTIAVADVETMWPAYNPELIADYINRDVQMAQQVAEKITQLANMEVRQYESGAVGIVPITMPTDYEPCVEEQGHEVQVYPRDIIVSHHAAKRYAQRVLGITPEYAAETYRKEHMEELANEILAQFHSSEHLWNNNDGSSFWLGDCNRVFLVKPGDYADADCDVIVTMFIIAFGFTEDIDRSIIYKQVEHLSQVEEEYKRLEEEIADENVRLEHRLLSTKDDIAVLKSKLAQLEAEQLKLYHHRDSLQKSVKHQKDVLAKEYNKLFKKWTD